MPVNVVRPIAAPSRAPLAARLLPASNGWVEFHPRYRERLAVSGLLTAEAILGLPGEIVSGHPDRHVLRVELAGWDRACFLKRQHCIGWRERLRQKLAGFGWSSRCQREARMLRDLDRAGFPGPQWIAFGEDGNGRAFLLVEELTDAVGLRQLLSDTQLSLDDSMRLADRLGQAVAELHAAGFTTPDLTAKHVFVNRESFAITLIDWQSARRVKRLSERERLRSLAALNASLSEQFAGTRERLRFLWAYSRVARKSGGAMPRFSKTLREIERLSKRSSTRRSIRDQRQTLVTGPEQRLVWVADEAVCAVPEIASVWPKPALVPPFYRVLPATISIRLPDGRPAELVRGQSFAPFARLASYLRGKPWRSPGVTFGRVLFHLQRYGIPAPQLYAFGQRETSRASAEWFALYEPPAGTPLADWLATTDDDSLRQEVLEQAGYILRQLHDSGCRASGSASIFFVADEPTGRVTLGGLRSVQFTKKITERVRSADLHAILGLDETDRVHLERGYRGHS